MVRLTVTSDVQLITRPYYQLCPSTVVSHKALHGLTNLYYKGPRHKPWGHRICTYAILWSSGDITANWEPGTIAVFLAQVIPNWAPGEFTVMNTANTSTAMLPNLFIHNNRTYPPGDRTAVIWCQGLNIKCLNPYYLEYPWSNRCWFASNYSCISVTGFDNLP